MAEVIMPKMGDAMTEGKLLSWKKRPGDPVAKGETIAEIETDKVNAEVEAEESGVLLETLISEGQSAPVGATIALIGAPGQKVQPRPAAQTRTPTPATSAPGPTQATPRAPATASVTAADAERVKASPLARKLAAEHAIDLASIKGTGPEGRITKEDVEALIATGARPKPAVSPVVSPTGPRDGEFESVPLTRIRQTIGRRLSESKQQAPHFYVTVEVEMDAALRVRQQLNETLDEQQRVSVNDFALKATALALRKFPNVNSALVEGAIRRYRRINMALAVALPEGLIAPVIHDCDRLTLPQIATAAKGLGERARSGKLRAEDLDGGTFTVTNLGMFGDIDSFSAIINPPQTGILAVGKAMPRAVVRNGQIVPATTMKLTLSADHRVTDGAEGAQYLQEVKRLLENPLLLVLDQH